MYPANGPHLRILHTPLLCPDVAMRQRLHRQETEELHRRPRRGLSREESVPYPSKRGASSQYIYLETATAGHPFLSFLRGGLLRETNRLFSSGHTSRLRYPNQDRKSTRLN